MSQQPNQEADHQPTESQPLEEEFAATEVQERAEMEPGWWSESTDGQCSEYAALFAASQPAPLSIV